MREGLEPELAVAVDVMLPMEALAQLETFRKGERAGTTNARIMQGVARTLDPESSAALGAYLATLAIE